MAQWLDENEETLIARSKEMENAKNSERVSRYMKARASRDPEWKTMITMRHKLSSMLVRKWARAGGGDWITPKRDRGTCMKLCGCTLKHLREHFEKQFKPGMTWENHGKTNDCWVIDHVKPICLFDWWTQSGRIEAFQWENLQPLWVWEHRAKSNHDAAKARRRAMADKDLKSRLKVTEYPPDMEGTNEEIMARLKAEIGEA